MYYPLDNEIAVLKSRSLIQNVISDLKLNIRPRSMVLLITVLYLGEELPATYVLRVVI